MIAADPNQPAARNESILILARESANGASTRRTIGELIPNASITMAEDLEHYKVFVRSADFDLVVLEYDMPLPQTIELVSELKFKEYEPSVLVVGDFANVKDVMELQRVGAHRVVLKGPQWLDELGPAIRSLLRVRRLIEENRRLQAKLLEANMFLEAKNVRLDEFSATVAHDIRGPLGGICMKLEYLIDTYGSQVDDRFLGILKRALASSNRLTEIVQAMYDFAKIGSRVTNMLSVDLAQLIREVVIDMNLDENREIEIGINQLPQIWGSPDLLRRVFINLIGNAVKYNDKPVTRINIDTIAISERALGRFVEFYVEDNGPGIDEADLKEIFNMFRRGTDDSAKSTEGLGVGLSVVQRIVELHYGSISVSSEKGKSTRFVISLPLEKIDFIS